jgi:16S rRNA processing protein RimM
LVAILISVVFHSTISIYVIGLELSVHETSSQQFYWDIRRRQKMGHLLPLTGSVFSILIITRDYGLSSNGVQKDVMWVYKFIFFVFIHIHMAETFHIGRNFCQYRLLSVRMNADEKAKTVRRERRNKYSTFSRNKRDPLLVAMERHNEQTIQEQNDAKGTVRGTTVPTIEASEPLTSSSTKPESRFANISLSDIDPSDPYSFGYLHIGHIGSPHGVKGEVKLRAISDFAEVRLQKGNVIFVKKPNRMTPRPVRVLSSRMTTGNNFLVSLKGIRTRLGAAAFKGYSVFVKKEDRPALGDDEFLIRELVDLRCYCASKDHRTAQSYLSLGDPLGVVEGVIPPDELAGSNAALMHPMLEISFLNDPEYLCLVPFVPQIVLDIDLNTRVAVLDPPKGLLSLRYKKPVKITVKGYLPSRATISDSERAQLLEYC